MFVYSFTGIYCSNCQWYARQIFINYYFIVKTWSVWIQTYIFPSTQILKQQFLNSDSTQQMQLPAFTQIYIKHNKPESLHHCCSYHYT